MTRHSKKEGIMHCNIRPLLLCAALVFATPAHAQDSPARCASAEVTMETPQGCVQRGVSSGKRYPFSHLFDEQSGQGGSLAFAAIMIGALALCVGLR
jgi:hypothetical protein